jgi:hypothetical protein
VDVITILGQIALALILLMLLGLIVLVILLLIYLKTGRPVLGGLFIFLLDLLDSPLKALFRLFRVEDELIDRTFIEIQNTLLKSSLEKVPYNDRILFLPQCLRHKDCKAPLTRKGLICLKCGKCSIGEIVKEAEKLGYKGIYVVPGSSFIRRLIKASKPGAVIGVACLPESKHGIQILTKYKVTGQAIPLLKSGCIDTVADVERIMETIRWYVPPKSEESSQ